MSEATNQKRDPFAVLNDLREVNRRDTRPRFEACPLKIGGEKLRFRRLQFELLLAMKDRLRSVGYKPGQPINAKQRGELLHLVQISLVPLDNSALRFAGPQGRTQLSMLLEPEQIDGLAAALVEWNEVFDPVETESTPSTKLAVDPNTP